MEAPVSEVPVADATPPTSGDLAQLRDALKRCTPATIEAACAFRHGGDRSQVATIIFGVLERYVERDLRPKLQRYDDSVRLIEDLGLDSLTMIEIVVLIEDVMQISVSNEELTGLRTVGDVRHFVAAKLTPQTH